MDLYIDGDGLFYHAYYSSMFKQGEDIGGDFIGEVREIPLKLYYLNFYTILSEVISDIEFTGYTFDKVVVVFSDSKNFRYEIYPEYKANRRNKEEPINLKRLKKKIKAEHLVVPNTEADDVCYYYGHQGHMVASLDKDVLYSVPLSFDYYPSRRNINKNSDEEINKFVLLQTLMGDSTDNIKGLPRVGISTAEKMLRECNNFDDVVKKYKTKGLGYEEALLTRRLVGLDQWSPDGGIKLWEPENNEYT